MSDVGTTRRPPPFVWPHTTHSWKTSRLMAAFMWSSVTSTLIFSWPCRYSHASKPRCTSSATAKARTGSFLDCQERIKTSCQWRSWRCPRSVMNSPVQSHRAQIVATRMRFSPPLAAEEESKPSRCP